MVELPAELAGVGDAQRADGDACRATWFASAAVRLSRLTAVSARSRSISERMCWRSREPERRPAASALALLAICARGAAAPGAPRPAEKLADDGDVAAAKPAIDGEADAEYAESWKPWTDGVLSALFSALLFAPV